MEAMSKRKYRIAEKTWGLLGTDSYEFAAGEVTPKDAHEEQLLEHLVNIGRAEVVVTAAKSKKEA
jgi:hypothetical protein